MPGFPSYCAGSLLMITSSTTCCRCPCIGHHVFLHTRPGNRPNQVRFRYVPSTSYRFLQTPPLASDALASRIQFPMNRAWSLTSSDWVCQLRWANENANGSFRSHLPTHAPRPLELATKRFGCRVGSLRPKLCACLPPGFASGQVSEVHAPRSLSISWGERVLMLLLV